MLEVVYMVWRDKHYGADSEGVVWNGLVWYVMVWYGRDLRPVMVWWPSFLPWCGLHFPPPSHH